MTGRHTARHLRRSRQEAPPRASGHWAARVVASSRFASMLYVFVVAFLVLATLIPAVVSGWQPLAVVSGSMQPAVMPGAMVLVQPADPDRFYAAPSIIAFDDAARPGRLVTHRVVGTVKDDSGNVTYTTRGDANRVRDSGDLPHEQVMGAVRMVVPHVGLPQMWLHDGHVAKVAAMLLVSLLAVTTLLVRARP